ncbi:MAG: hypothetical protein RSE12_17025 [Fuscovulum sp.]|nr:MAG: hypothetical protein RSE12_17025 [Fuscovulum sp.]
MAGKRKEGRGRPSDYDPAMCDKVIGLGDTGMGKCEMARELGIAYNTFEAWQDEHPEFLKAVKEALARSQAWWEQNGRIATFGGVQGFNATSYIFQMKNRFRQDWNDTVRTELTGRDGGPIQTQDVTVEALIDEARRLGIDPEALGLNQKG